MHSLAKRINGKFRTPKLEALHRMIHWLNEHNKFEKLDLLPLDNSNLNLNAWLAGFSDCDSNFLITYSNSNGIAKDIKLVFRISQRQIYHRDSELGTSYLPVLTDIAKVFKTKGERSSPFERNRVNQKNNYIELGYLVTVSSLSSRIELINYFSNFPLLSSKYLDYQNWLEAHEIVISKKYRGIDGTAKLVELKNSMNSKRNYFSWNHLNTYNGASLLYLLFLLSPPAPVRAGAGDRCRTACRTPQPSLNIIKLFFLTNPVDISLTY